MAMEDSFIGSGCGCNLSYDETIKQLDIYFGIVKRQLLKYQGPCTGLFPRFSIDKKIGSVRDSIYCAAAIWSLFQAYRRIDDDRGRAHELGQSAVKCMRGILECWMKQAPRVERFKQNQSASSALHCKFDLETGEPVLSDTDYNHLQIDVVSLFLIFLVQMISSGLYLIYTYDEVAFIQNLVYYVERAYRTPDFGMWGRGSKYNSGTPEIHASSIGMAKAALETINAFNLFGDKGSSWSVIYVDADAHNRNRSIFETLLPRESYSKNTDASLLPTISFPAFATHEESIYAFAKAKVIRKLKGTYGFKRYLRDGYKSVLEDSTRRLYSEGESQIFENVECEWPMFYLYLIIDGVFKGLTKQVEEYCQLAKERLVRDSYGDPIVPMCFYVPQENINEEKQEPKSQIRISTPEGTSDNIFLWGQSLYIIAQLLTSGLLSVNEIDVVRRYATNFRRPLGKYSAFEGVASDLVVQVVLIAESLRLQAMMKTYGIQTQTPHEIEPVQIWPPSQLVKVYELLGVSSKLKLGGRPGRPIGTLGTSKIYRICGQTILCYPLIFEVSDFYLSRDMALLIDDIKSEIQFVGKYWRLSGRPTLCILVREEHMRDRQFKEMLDLFASLKKGYCSTTKVRIGRLQNLLSSSCIEHLDFTSMSDIELPEKSLTQLMHHYGFQSLTDIPKAIIYNEPASDFHDWGNRPIQEIVEAYMSVEGYFGRCQLLGHLLKREGPNFLVDGDPILELLHQINRTSGTLRLWSAVRLSSSLLCQLVDSISPTLTTILVNGKQVTVGVIGCEEVLFKSPMTPNEMKEEIYSKVQPFDAIQAVLQQEIILYCGKLIQTDPDLFEGILKIRSAWVLRAIAYFDEDSNPIESASPSEVRRRLQKLLTMNQDEETKSSLSVLRRRQIEGCLCRVPKNFYLRVWHVLKKSPRGIVIVGNLLPQEPTLSNMSLSDLNFALEVERLLHSIEKPESIQIAIELLCVVSTILNRNPELSFKEPLDVDVLVSSACKMFLKDQNVEQDVPDSLNLFLEAPMATTTGYLARAMVNNILQGDMGNYGNYDEFAHTDSCSLV